MDGAYSTYGTDENAYISFVGKLDGKDRLEDLGVDGKVWTGCIWLRTSVSQSI